jgi:phosphoglucosamine mutase
LTGGGVVATVMSNLGLERYLRSLDLELVRTNVGDRYVLEHMHNHGFNVGGEQSGHMILSDYATTGDGLLAALQVLSVMVQKQQRLSEVSHVFDPVPQILKNVRFAGQSPLEHPKVKDCIKDVEARLTGKGRLLIRKSGTEPLLRVMAEGDDAQLINEAVDEVIAVAEAATKEAAL